MKKLWIIGILTLVVVLVAAGSQAALSAPNGLTPIVDNLLTNPGFESGDTSGWTVGGTAAWVVDTDGTAIGDDLGPATVEVRTGTFAFVNKTASTISLGTTLSQTVTVLPDTTYEVGFYSVHSDRIVGLGFEIDVNGTDVPVEDLQSEQGNGAGTDPGDFALRKGTYTTTAGQTTATVTFKLFASGLAKALMSYDDFFFLLDIELYKCGVHLPTILGTNAPDVLLGTPGDDVIVGLGGGDIIHGKGGNDIICAGDGWNVVSGGDGDDWIAGGRHPDTINGGDGWDIIWGGGGWDLIIGGGDPDRIHGGSGDDQIAGGPGDDILFGNGGSDKLLGDDGDDMLFGGNGDDDLQCGPGSDAARGNRGTDSADPDCELTASVP